MIGFSNTSHREWQIAATLALDLMIASFYFSGLMSLPAGLAAGAGLGLLIVKVVVLAVMGAALLFGLLRWRFGALVADERDHHIDAKANGIAYGALSFCIVLLAGQLGLDALGLSPWHLSPLLCAHLLLMALLLASGCKALVQLYLYRRGG